MSQQEHLCQQETSPTNLYSWGLCVSSWITHARCEEVWHQSQACSSLHWYVSYSGEALSCGLQVGAFALLGRCTWYVPCLAAQEMLEGTHQCHHQQCCTSRGRSMLSRASDEAVGSTGSGHEEKDNPLLQGSMKPTFQRRSHVGNRGFPPLQLSRFFPPQ
jgi:hypothetical protein